jgi:hypothetical protein
MIRIPITISYEELEVVLKDKSSEVHVELLPTQAYSPGLLPILLQVIFTKVRNSEKLVISFDIDSKDESFIFDHFYRFYHFLSIVLFGKPVENVVLLDKRGFPFSKERLYSNSISTLNLLEQVYSATFESTEKPVDSTKSKIEELRRKFFSDRSEEKTYEGLSLFISSFDHVRALNNTSYFYNAQGELRTKAEIISWVSKIFKYNRLNIREGLYRNQTHNDIAIVLKELYDNTDEWARYSYDNKKEYIPNIRSCFLNILMDRSVGLVTQKTANPVVDYVTTLVQSKPEDLYIPTWQSELYYRAKVGLCEISVLDTGPGMARRWLRRDYDLISIQDEIKAVTDCFNKYMTSDTTARFQVRGRGLHNVMKVIGASGYLIVRTGRLTIHRNFFEEKLSRYEAAAGLAFNAEVGERIEGTSITIIYPFLYHV